VKKQVKKMKKVKRQEPDFEYTKETIRGQPKSDTLLNFPNTDTRRRIVISES